MQKMVFVCLLSAIVCIGLLGCADDEESDDSEIEDSDNENQELNYNCIEELPSIPEDCGPYPEEEAWDMGSVVTNLTFDAFYDRDCDGKPERTTLNMYRDIYCQRDKIKSVVILAGSSCGEDEGIV
ncbi:MAG: hypothetical protein GY847_36865 [Proteobacteria bacterium]|nr:hypothetical protein [Pseudomonadota bacterium]